MDKKSFFSADDRFPNDFRWSDDGRYFYYFIKSSQHYPVETSSVCYVGDVNTDLQRLDLQTGSPEIYIARVDGSGEWRVKQIRAWANSLYWGP